MEALEAVEGYKLYANFQSFFGTHLHMAICSAENPKMIVFWYNQKQ